MNLNIKKLHIGFFIFIYLKKNLPIQLFVIIVIGMGKNITKDGQHIVIYGYYYVLYYNL